MLARQFCKLCDLRDFDDAEFLAMLREIVPGKTSEQELRRKYWEYAMLGLYLRDAALLRDDVDVLAVAAGHEAPLFWLANHVHRVLAIDLYGEGGFADREADSLMLTDPSHFAPYPYREDRLEVRHMDATRLDLPKASFDVVYSLSSIEHFGARGAIRRSAAEMARVLRPGGHLIVVTECYTASHLLDIPAVQFAIRLLTLGRRARRATPSQRVEDVMTERELKRDVVRPTGLRLVQPLDTTVSPETFANVTTMAPDGSLHPASGRELPHLALRTRGAPWTSAFLALV